MRCCRSPRIVKGARRGSLATESLSCAAAVGSCVIILIKRSFTCWSWQSLASLSQELSDGAQPRRFCGRKSFQVRTNNFLGMFAGTTKTVRTEKQGIGALNRDMWVNGVNNYTVWSWIFQRRVPEPHSKSLFPREVRPHRHFIGDSVDLQWEIVRAMMRRQRRGPKPIDLRKLGLRGL